MYSNTAAVLRPDLMGVVDQGALPTELFIAEKAAPVYDSPTKDGQYPKFKSTTSGNLDDDVKPRGRNGSYPQVVRSFDYDTFSCQDYGIKEPIDDAYDRRDLGRFFDVEMLAANRAAQANRLRLERLVAAIFMSTSYFSTTAAAVNWTETNIATINHAKDFQGRIENLLSVGVVANTIIMSSTLFNQMVRSTLFRGLLTAPGAAANTGPLATPAMAAQVLGVDQVLVGKAYYNTARKGKTLSTSAIWGTTYAWIGRVSTSQDLLDLGSVRIIRWKEDAPSNQLVETYRDEDTRSDVVRCRMNVVTKQTADWAGELITTSYSAS